MNLHKLSRIFLSFTSFLVCNAAWAGAPAPVISANPTTLTSSLLCGEGEQKTLTITNSGGSDLTWEILESTDECPGSDIPWISVSPTSGTTPPGGSTPATVIFDATGLATGGYAGNLCVNSNDPVNSTLPIEVSLTVTCSVNEPPECDEASPSRIAIWPPNHKFLDVQVLGISDPDGDPVTITIDSIYQDEEVDERGDGKHAPDGDGIGTSIAEVRAERKGSGNGRVYHISFTATDSYGNNCQGIVMTSVPHDQSGAPAVDEGPLYDSTITP